MSAAVATPLAPTVSWRERVTHPSRATTLAVAVAALVVLAVAIAVIDQYPVGVVHDDGMYMILAKSLATGHGYRYINLPGEPHATHFPPGYPLLLSLLWRIGPAFPANVVFFKLVNAVFLAAAAAMLALFARRRLAFSAPAACLTAIAGCAGIPVLVLSNLVMSETVFLALLVPALLYAETCFGRDETSAREAVALALIGGLLMFVRSHGIAFVAAVGLVLLVRRRFRALAIYAAVAVVVALPWHFWQSMYAGSVPAPMRGDYESYGGWFLNGSPAHSIAFVARTIVKQAQTIYAMLFVFATSGIPTRLLRHFGTVVTIALMVAGLISMRRRAPVTALFVCGFLGIIFVWPFTPARFVWAIWPLLVLVFVTGTLVILRRLREAKTPDVILRPKTPDVILRPLGEAKTPKDPFPSVPSVLREAKTSDVILRPKTPDVILRPLGEAKTPKDPFPSVPSILRLLLAAGAAITLVGYATYNTRGYKGSWWSSIAREQSATVGPMIVWLARNTAPNDVIATNSEVMVYLYTGRHTVPATQFLAEDYFTAPIVADRAATLRSILQSYRAGVVAVAQNETLDAAARSMTAGQDPMLVLRDSVPGALIFLSTRNSPSQTPTVGAQRPTNEP